MRPQSPPRLSVAMLVRDAEDHLADGLADIAELADEIVIADAGSTDRTLEIARRRATRVIEIPWTDDFSAARNAIWDSLTGDWILWLDAGERISATTARALRNFLDTTADRHTGYLLNIAVPNADGQGLGERAARLRLVPQRDDWTFCGRVREQLRYSPAAGELRVEIAPGIIERGTREYDVRVRRIRAERNLRLADLDQHENGATARIEIVRGEAYAVLEKHEKASAAFRRAIALAERGSTEQLDAYYGLLTAFDSLPNKTIEQLAVAAAAVEAFPFDAQLLCATGNILRVAGRLDLAANAYQTAAQHGQVNVETWHLPEIAEVAGSCWAMTLDRLGRGDRALAVMEHLCAGESAGERSIRQLLDLYVAADMRGEALELSRRLPHAVRERDAFRAAIRGACLAGQGRIAEALVFLRGAYADGCRDAFCRAWLAQALVSAAEFAEALTVLNEWHRQEPRNPIPLRIAQSIPKQDPSTGRITRIDPPEMLLLSPLGTMRAKPAGVAVSR